MIAAAFAASVRRIELFYRICTNQKGSNTTLGGCTSSHSFVGRTRVPGEDLVTLYESSSSKGLVAILLRQ